MRKSEVPTTKLLMNMPIELHKKLKREAFENDTTMKDIVLKLVAQYFEESEGAEKNE